MSDDPPRDPLQLSEYRDQMENAATPPRRPEDDGLPPDLPVTPLGTWGGRYFFLDILQQFRDLADKDMGRLPLLGLFGGDEYLLQHWPRLDKKGNTVGLRPEQVQADLIAACTRRGVWDPDAMQRSTGAWRGPADELVIHCGDRVLVRPTRGPESWHAPGLLGRTVYASAPALPPPWPGPASATAAHDLLRLLEQWPFRRGRLDAVLLLGWLGAGMLGGALKWRPVVWLTGGAGTGKSTLKDEVIAPLFGDGGLVSVSDATAAGIWQTLRRSTLPVVLDELEADIDNRKADKVVELARQAASGGLILRGGSDHRGHGFEARSCFMFQSINMLPLRAQDASRISVLELTALGDRAEPRIRRAQVADWGRQIRRRLIDAWPRLPATLERIKGNLMAPGDDRFDRRGADVYGTLLACAELALYDDPEERDADARSWHEQLRTWGGGIAGDVLADEDELLSYLLTSPLDAYKSGARQTVAEWLRRAAGLDDRWDGSIEEARRIVETAGLKVTGYPPTDPKRGPTGRPVQYLAIANRHRGLQQLLDGTHWGALSGRQPVWVQAMRRLAARHDGIERTETMWFAGAASRAVLLPVSAVLTPAPGAHLRTE